VSDPSSCCSTKLLESEDCLECANRKAGNAALGDASGDGKRRDEKSDAQWAGVRWVGVAEGSYAILGRCFWVRIVASPSIVSYCRPLYRIGAPVSRECCLV
jgi:hypothetical protein